MMAHRTSAPELARQARGFAPRAGATRLEFHRVETRLVHTMPRGEIGTECAVRLEEASNRRAQVLERREDFTL